MYFENITPQSTTSCQANLRVEELDDESNDTELSQLIEESSSDEELIYKETPTKLPKMTGVHETTKGDESSTSASSSTCFPII